MARVTLASFALVSLKLGSDGSRYRKEDPVVRGEDASLLTKTLLHCRRTAAMADDKRATLPHRICEREVNLPFNGVTHAKSAASLNFFFVSINIRWNGSFLSLSLQWI